MSAATILSDADETAVDAIVDRERVLVAASDFAGATGWALKPEGLCRGEVCVPLRAHADVVSDGRIDAAGVAALIGRAVIVDPVARVVAYGEPAATVGAALSARQAADFTLEQLDGTPFTFSAIGRKKKLLVTWASW